MSRFQLLTITLMLSLGACKSQRSVLDDSSSSNGDNSNGGGSGGSSIFGTVTTGTSGSDFNIVEASGGFTFNLPDSSSSNRGALSSSDWSTFNSKLSNLSDDTTPSLGGNLDVAGNSITSSAGQDINLSPDSGQDVVVSSAVSRNGFFQAYVATSSNITTSDTVAFDAQTRIDSTYYSHSTSSNAEQITILKSGFYKISYSVNFYSNYGNRLTLRSFLEFNSAELIPSKAYCYTRHTSYVRHCTNSVTLIANLTAGQVLTLKVDGSTNNTFPNNQSADIVANQTWILIEKI